MIMRLMEMGRASRVGFGGEENKSVDRYQSWMFNRMKHLDSKCNLPRSHPSSPPPSIPTHSLQRNEPRAVRRSNTGSSVLDRLITDREFTQIMPHHLRFDFHLIEFLARVNANHAPDHLGHHNHIAQVRLD